jgi:hypothetical protein
MKQVQKSIRRKLVAIVTAVVVLGAMYCLVRSDHPVMPTHVQVEQNRQWSIGAVHYEMRHSR